jgi:glycogen debranching enzyme
VKKPALKDINQLTLPPVNGKKRLVPYKEWADLIQASFEKHYYVPAHASEDAHFAVNPALINRRGMYKDVYGTPADREFSDYQLRCNFTLPMVVAPELFTPERAMTALKLADRVIRGPLGMKTLDPSDWAYRPNYDNSNDGTDQAIAKGWNYHQGPEWGFPLGWFLTAWLRFDPLVDSPSSLSTAHHVSQILLRLREHVDNDPWRGLPELCNDDGAYCSDSCNTQAWSASTILDVLEEMHAMGDSA